MSAVPQPQRLLSDAAYARIDREIAKYPPEQKQSAVMSALAIAQDETGWVSQQVIEAIAAYLGMPPIAVHEVATFYNMYDLEPTAKNKVCVCNSISCMLNGSEELIAHVASKYGLKPGQTSSDGRFTFKEAECLGACRHAPAVLVGHTYHEGLTPEALDKLIEGLD